jgi:hypothetical protein
MNSAGGAPFGARVFPNTFLIGMLNAGSPDIWKWYNEPSAAKQRGFRQLIDIAFFKYMLQWQRRVSEGNEDVIDTMINNLADQFNAFSAAYNSNPYTKGVLRRVIRQTLQTWYSNPLYVPVEAEATIVACMHVYLIIDGVHYVVPHEKVIQVMPVEGSSDGALVDAAVVLDVVAVLVLFNVIVLCVCVCVCVRC